jgi:short-subunit dehydrogenase
MNNKDKTALITGASSGIGLQFARELTNKSNNFVMVGRNAKKLEDAKKSLTNENQVISLQSDLSKREAAFEIYRYCEDQSIGIDLLINNAGVGLFGEHVELSTDDLENMIMLNVMTLTLLCRLFGKKMKERKSGYILNLSSTAAYQPVPKLASYAAAKSYVLNFTEALSMELADHGVTVTCLSPGHTDTSFFANAGIGNDTKGFFAKSGRMKVDEVTRVGIDALFHRKMSVIAGGLKDKLLIFSNRFGP